MQQRLIGFQFESERQQRSEKRVGDSLTQYFRRMPPKRGLLVFH